MVQNSDTEVAASIVVAAYNSASWIEQTLASIRRQTLSDLEIIVVDDGSTDDTVRRVQAVCDIDARVRLIALPANAGPAAARNRGLAAARGRWIAIVDSDDLISDDRMERLVAACEVQGLDIACDNMVLFRDDTPRSTLLIGGLTKPLDISATTFIDHNCMKHGVMSLGYLQPVIRGDLIRRLAIRYDEHLLVAEDFDFVLRLLVAGAVMRVFPWATYFYRRHPGSLSYRLKSLHVRKMLQADDTFRRLNPASLPALGKSLDARRSTLVRLLAFSTLVEALQRRHLTAAMRVIVLCPSILIDLRNPLANRLRQLWQRAQIAM